MTDELSRSRQPPKEMHVKFRRKSTAPTEVEPGGPGNQESGNQEAGNQESGDQSGDQSGDAASGPYDVSEVDVESMARVDLGSLLIPPSEGRELRVQVDETTQAVQSVMIAGPEGALELRAFAAPRNGDLWSDVRLQIVADLEKRGGSSTEREGRFGPELACQRPVQLPDGKSVLQPARIIGINGSRWFLRATLLGGPARSAEAGASWEEILSHVVVRRGEHAMPVGDPLPITLPSDARRLPSA